MSGEYAEEVRKRKNKEPFYTHTNTHEKLEDQPMLISQKKVFCLLSCGNLSKKRRGRDTSTFGTGNS